MKRQSFASYKSLGFVKRLHKIGLKWVGKEKKRKKELFGIEKRK